MFTDCVQWLSEERCVILVTHQVQFATGATKILALSPYGGQLGLGTYDELEADGVPLVDESSLGEEEEGDQVSGRRARARTLSSTAHTSSAGDPGKGAESQEVASKEEDKTSGTVTAQTYLDYLSFYARAFGLVLLLLLFATTQTLQIMTDWFLAYWVDLDSDDRQNSRNLSIYSGLVVALVSFSFLRGAVFMAMSTRVGIYLSLSK